MTKNNHERPQSWATARLDQVGEINPTINKSKYEDDLVVSFVPMPAVEAESGKIDVSGSRSFGSVRKGYTHFQQGDVLFAKITPCMENGKMAIVPEVKNGLGFGSTEFHVLRPSNGVESVFVYYFVSSVRFRYDAEHNMSGAVGQRRVPAPYLSGCEIPVPPTNEQHRIVAKIEELFSELDKGIESLKRAREQLRTYRQAVLKHAFEGKLTADWRAANADKLETPDQLLARIRTEREACYQQQLKEWEAAAKVSAAGGRGHKKLTKPKKPGELPSLSSDELAELPSLPEGYTYTYLSNVGDLGRGKSKHRPRNDPQLFGGAYPFIQTGEVTAANRIIREHTKSYSEIGLAQSKLWPKGTLCITIAANIAETAFLGFDGCFPDSVVGFSAVEELVLPEYVELFIKAVRARIEAYAPATAQKNINLATLEKLVIPLCSLREQRFLVKKVEAILSVIDENEDVIETNIVRTSALRQSILKKAFSGQLVSQNPNDEPASRLLERIRAGKAAQATPKRARKTRTPA